MNRVNEMINALRKCAKEHENDVGYTGQIMTSSLCRDVADYLEADRWHYPSRGELPDKDWTKHPDNVSKKCFIITEGGIGAIARWDNDYRTWFENQPRLPMTKVIAWQYFIPPKEEA